MLKALMVELEGSEEYDTGRWKKGILIILWQKALVDLCPTVIWKSLLVIDKNGY